MNKKIYIISQIFIENGGSFSGFVEDFAKYASKLGYKVIILAAREGKEQPLHELKDYAEIYRFPTRRGRLLILVSTLPLIFKIRKFFKKNPPSKDDIIVANGDAALTVWNKKYVLRAPDQPARIFLKNMKVANKEVSLFSRFARTIHFNIFYIVDHIITKKAAGIIYSSMANKENFERYYHINKPYFSPNKCVKIDELKRNLDPKKRRILFVGKGSEKIRKGIIHLEKVLPDIFKEFGDVELVHIGGDMEWNVPDWCKKRIISIGRVSWSEMKKYYESCDLIVHCSLSEGIASVLIEGMASGIPTLSSDIDGIYDYITHLKEGYVYKRGDVKELKEGISYMLKNPEISRKMGIEARSKIKAIEYKIYYKELINFLERIFDNQKVESINLFDKKD